MDSGSCQLQVLDAECIITDGFDHYVRFIILGMALPSLSPFHYHRLEPLLKDMIHNQHVQLIHADLHKDEGQIEKS